METRKMLSNEAPALSLITVSGTSEIRVVPDEVVLRLGVKTRHSNLQIAKAQNDSRIKRVIAIALEFGVSPVNMKYDKMLVEPEIVDDETSRASTFVVEKVVSFLLKDITKCEDMLARVLEAGVNVVYGLDFRTTKIHELKNRARILALKAAKAKAISLAQEVGQYIGKVYSIEEEPSAYDAPYASVVEQIENNSTHHPETLAVGHITIREKITVSFCLL
jgi:hypothetical protein